MRISQSAFRKMFSLFLQIKLVTYLSFTQYKVLIKALELPETYLDIPDTQKLLYVQYGE